MTSSAPTSRIRERNTQAILAAALEVFSAQGFRGATLDQIAAAANLSKPNLYYYFRSKEAVYLALLESLLESWLAPLRAIDPSGEPVAEMLSYIRSKVLMSRSHPRESRLFAGEVLGGAQHIRPVLEGPLRLLVDEKAALIARWMDEGRLAPSDPHHLIFSIWALTQHYADFAPQVAALLGKGRDPIEEGLHFAETLYRRMLTP